MDILEAENVNIIELIQKNSEIAQMQTFLQTLTPREKEIIIYLYGLANQEEVTQREIADKLDTSRSYVSHNKKMCFNESPACLLSI